MIKEPNAFGCQNRSVLSLHCTVNVSFHQFDLCSKSQFVQELPTCLTNLAPISSFYWTMEYLSHISASDVDQQCIYFAVSLKHPSEYCRRFIETVVGLKIVI